MRYVEDARALPDRLTRGQKLLGLDLGSKTIGLAVSDTGLKIATPRETIKRRKFGVDAERLEQVIAADDIGGLVVGLPVNMNGTHGARAESTKAFIRNLGKRDGFPDLPVLFQDERLSTAAVERTLIEADMSRAKRAQVVDKMAAAYILQGALDRIAHD